MDLIKQLNWRYAAKRMNGNKVPAEKLDTILEAIRLSASSAGVQPYTILLIENETVRKKINENSCKQPQILECSHLLVFCAWTKLTEEEINDYLTLIVTTRGVTTESLQGLKTSLISIATRFNDDQLFAWSSRQLYIALGSALVAAAVAEVDSTPMEGFNAVELDVLLNLQEKNLRSVALMPLGYRNEEIDFLAKAKKVRRAQDLLFIKIDEVK